jgi:hypothetical protein
MALKFKRYGYSENSSVVNYGFDVTPARLITGLITERGICKADKESILTLFPENRKSGLQTTNSKVKFKVYVKNCHHRRLGF